MKLKNNLILMLTALIWGVAFVAQSVGMDYVGPFTFNAVRSLIGGLVLIPCIFLLDRLEGGKKDGRQDGQKTLILGGVCCGVCLGVASSLQQIGIAYTTVGKAGFITALYIIIVPLLGMFMKKKVTVMVWASVLLAALGMYFLCITEEFRIGRGDILVMLCAVCFSVHILVIDYFSPKVDGVKMSCIQFIVSGLLCSVPMLLFEHPRISAIFHAWAPILYAGVLSCGVGYTLQIIGQKGANPVVASLILSLESVFSALAGWLILHQGMSPREILGCVLVFGGIILAQLPERSRE